MEYLYDTELTLPQFYHLHIGTLLLFYTSFMWGDVMNQKPGTTLSLDKKGKAVSETPRASRICHYNKFSIQIPMVCDLFYCSSGDILSDALMKNL